MHRAFYGCTGPTEVVIPEGVTGIGAYAFEGCAGLTEVAIPEGVISIRTSAFYVCTSPTQVAVPEGRVIRANAFGGVPVPWLMRPQKAEETRAQGSRTASRTASPSLPLLLTTASGTAPCP